jgi:hypothetical protein
LAAIVLIGVDASSDSAMFSAAVSASNSEKCWNTMPMPSFLATLGLVMEPVCPFQKISPVIRLQRAEQHLYQRRLAGAVLAQQCMNLALAECPDRRDRTPSATRRPWSGRAFQAVRRPLPKGYRSRLPQLCIFILMFPSLSS